MVPVTIAKTLSARWNPRRSAETLDRWKDFSCRRRNDYPFNVECKPSLHADSVSTGRPGNAYKPASLSRITTESRIRHDSTDPEIVDKHSSTYGAPENNFREERSDSSRSTAS